MTFEDLMPVGLLSARETYLEKEFSSAAPIVAGLKFEYPESGCLVMDRTGSANWVSLKDDETDCVALKVGPLMAHAFRNPGETV